MIKKTGLKNFLDAQLFKSNVLRWSLALAWMIVIFMFSHQANSGTITEEYFGLMNVPIRKFGHIVEYMVLYLLVKWALDGIKPSASKLNTIYTLTVAILYAASDEWHQSFVPGRSASVRDVVIDSIGATSGVLVYIILAKAKETILKTEIKSQP